MIRRNMRRAGAVLICIAVVSVCACGNRTEAVITEGEDITEASMEYPTVEPSDSDIFTYDDLTMGRVSYLMTESQVRAILGSPTEETENDDEKIYSYNEMSVGFEKLDEDNKPDSGGTYKVTQIASIGTDDTFSRNLKVGNTLDDILAVYYRNVDYRNKTYASEDGTCVYGLFLYGEFTTAELEKINTKDAIAYGLVNYNGYSSLETAESYNVEFAYFDKQYKGDCASYDDDFAVLNFELDSNNNITAISWYYYPEQK